MVSPTPFTIELRHLRYFLAVIEELHFGRAADRIHMSQPPLSQAIRKLEDELDVKLLNRTSRVVTPTDAGLVFAEQARRVLATFELAVAEARRAAGVSPTFRVGSMHMLPIERLHRFLTALREHDADSHPQVIHVSALEQVRRLRAGELDLGIFHYAEEHEEIEVEPLFAGEPLTAFLPLGHRLASKKFLGPEDLADEVLVTSPRDSNPALHDWLLRVLTDAGYRFAEVREASGPDVRDLMLSVVQGEGIALEPSSQKIMEASVLVVQLPLEPSLFMTDTVVGWRAEPPEELSNVLDAVREVAKGLRQASGEEAVRALERGRHTESPSKSVRFARGIGHSGAGGGPSSPAVQDEPQDTA